MDTIDIKCPHCGEELEATADVHGTVIACPSCNGQVSVPAMQKLHIPPKPARTAPSTQKTKPDVKEVVVTDIRMGFSSMVIFLVKWAVAAIPAAIILAVAGLIFWLVVLAFIGGCIEGMMGH